MAHRARIPFVRGLSMTIAAWGLLGALACSDDEGDDVGAGGSGVTGEMTGGTGAGGATAGSGGGGAASGGTGGAAIDAFNGDCSTARWSDVSEECWSCMCDACADTLNVCDETCMGVMTCAFASDCMVNVGSEILCEVRCFATECLADPAAQASAQALSTFDGCLIGAPKPSGFRVCEDVCQIPYPGDVCTRYP